LLNEEIRHRSRRLRARNHDEPSMMRCAAQRSMFIRAGVTPYVVLSVTRCCACFSMRAAVPARQRVHTMREDERCGFTFAARRCSHYAIRYKATTFAMLMLVAAMSRDTSFDAARRRYDTSRLRHARVTHTSCATRRRVYRRGNADMRRSDRRGATRCAQYRARRRPRAAYKERCAAQRRRLR